MSGIQDLLIRGSEKVVGHYRPLLASAKNEEKRELYRRSKSSVSSGCWTNSMAVSRKVRSVIRRPGEDRYAAFDIVLKWRGEIASIVSKLSFWRRISARSLGSSGRAEIRASYPAARGSR